MQFVRNGPPVPGEEKVWLRDKSYRAHRDREEDDDQIKVTIHTTPNYDYDPKISGQTNDKGNYSKWLNDAGETIEMLEMTQTVINNGRETTNGHHVNNYTDNTVAAAAKPNDAFDNL